MASPCLWPASSNPQILISQILISPPYLSPENTLKMTYTIGLDLGTTSAKAVAFDGEGRVLARSSRPMHTVSDGKGRQEQRCSDIVEAVDGLLAASPPQNPNKCQHMSQYGLQVYPEAFPHDGRWGS